jgi:predicted HTH domain antitoxin
MSMQIAIELPNDFVAFQSQGQIQRDISLSYALWLFKNEQVTIAKAAELAGLNIYEFIDACKANQVPVINISREELLDELEVISSR